MLQLVQAATASIPSLLKLSLTVGPPTTDPKSLLVTRVKIIFRVNLCEG